MMMATDDATLNTGNKTSNHKRNTRKEIKRKLEFVTGRKVGFMKNWSALEGFFKKKKKKRVCCSFSICHLLLESLNVLFQRKIYGWWEKVKAEEKQNRSRMNDLCSFWIREAKYKLPWSTHTFPLSEFEYFKTIPLFPDSRGHVLHTVLISPDKENFTWLWIYMMWPSTN